MRDSLDLLDDDADVGDGEADALAGADGDGDGDADNGADVDGDMDVVVAVAVAVVDDVGADQFMMGGGRGLCGGILSGGWMGRPVLSKYGERTR
jgi:hypothetical protein